MDARPLDRKGAALDRFANYFASYLQASFDLHEVSGTRFVTGPGGYCCERCGYRVPKSHLQPKKLGQRDKDKAQLLLSTFLENLAREEGVPDPSTAAQKVLNDPDHARDAALATYGAEVLRRLAGRGSGAAALALWRQIAWSPMGSPIKKFRLEAQQVIDAERNLIDGLRRAAAA